MNYHWTRDWVMPGAWRTPDGSNIISAETTPNGRIVVRTESSKTYFVPKRYMNRLRTKTEWVQVVAPLSGPKTVRIDLARPTKRDE